MVSRDWLEHALESPYNAALEDVEPVSAAAQINGMIGADSKRTAH